MKNKYLAALTIILLASCTKVTTEQTTVTKKPTTYVKVEAVYTNMDSTRLMTDAVK